MQGTLPRLSSPGVACPRLSLRRGGVRIRRKRSGVRELCLKSGTAARCGPEDHGEARWPSG
eukprot:8643543-Alexandrium_andersonii.AAC.1